MAFANTLADELNNKLTKSVEIATDNNLLEGVLVAVNHDSVSIAETVVSYVPTTKIVLIPISSINYVKILAHR